MQSRFCHASRVEATFESETGFLGRVIKCADNEKFARVALRASRESFIFGGEPLDHFRPRNVGANLGQDRQPTGGERSRDYSPKKSSAGPPSKIWIGSFSCSYS